MPAIPNLIERTMLLKLNQGPGPFMELIGALSFKAVSIALRLGIFEAISGGPLKPEKVADKIKSARRGTALLLDALESLGYVRKEDNRYANTDMTKKWMLNNSPNSLAHSYIFA